jgi:hypothetical protein
MNIKKIYNYLLFFGLVASISVPTKSLAYKLQQNDHIVIFADYRSRIINVQRLSYEGQKPFINLNGKSYLTSNSGTIPYGDNREFYYTIVGPGTALPLLLSGNLFDNFRKFLDNWRNSNDAHIICPELVASLLYTVMVNDPSNLSLDQLESGIRSERRIYENRKNIAASFHGCIDNLRKYLYAKLKQPNNPKAISFDALQADLCEFFFLWLHSMPGVSNLAAHNLNLNNDAALRRFQCINVCNFWPNANNSSICEFWDTVSALFLNIYEHSDVKFATGQALVEWILGELDWLADCVDFILESGSSAQPNTNPYKLIFLTKGCAIQLKNCCFLLYQYKAKMMAELGKLNSQQMLGNTQNIQAAMNTIDSISKSFDGRKLKDVDSLTNAALPTSNIINLLNGFMNERGNKLPQLTSAIGSLRQELQSRSIVGNQFLIVGLMESVERLASEMQKYGQWLHIYLGELAKIMPYMAHQPTSQPVQGPAAAPRPRLVSPQHHGQPVQGPAAAPRPRLVSPQHHGQPAQWPAAAPRANIPPAKPTLDLNKRVYDKQVNFGKLPVAHQSNVQRPAAHEKPQSTNASITATPIAQPSLASPMRKIDAPNGQPNLFRRSENKSVLSGPTKPPSHIGSHGESSRKSLTAKANTSSNPLQVVEDSSATLSELTSKESDLSKTQSFMPTISTLPVELNSSGVNSQFSNLAATQPVQTSGSFNNRRRARNSQRRGTRRGNRNRTSRKKKSGNRKSKKKTSRKKNSRRRTERENVKTNQ